MTDLTDKSVLLDLLVEGLITDADVDRIIFNEKLRNEIETTHDFYNKSGNGFCAGVTSQILALSNYGGVRVPKDKL